jgi:hypothetical protein
LVGTLGAAHDAAGVGGVGGAGQPVQGYDPEVA